MMCPINNLQEALLPHLRGSCREEICAVSIHQTKEPGRPVWRLPLRDGEHLWRHRLVVQRMPTLAIVQGQIWMQGGFGRAGHGQEVWG